MPKVIAIINKKTGAVTIKTEGIDGPACLKATEKLREGFGITAEPELTDQYYAAPTQEQQLNQDQG